MNKDFLFFKQGLMQIIMETWTEPENTNPTRNKVSANDQFPAASTS